MEGAAEKANDLFQWDMGGAWSYRRRAYQKMSDILVKRAGKAVAGKMHKEVYAVESEVTKHIHQALTPAMTIAAQEAREAIASIHL